MTNFGDRDDLEHQAFEGDKADVSAQLAQLREDLSNLARTVKGLGLGASHELRAQAARVADEALTASGEVAANVRDEISSLNDGVVTQVRKNPVQSLGIALAAGFLLAHFMRR